MEIEEKGLELLLHEYRIFRKRIIEILDNAFTRGALTQKERDIMYLRHIDWNSLENCGKQFGVTRERIRQIEAKAFEKLRHL